MSGTDIYQLRFNQVVLLALTGLALLTAQPWIIGVLFVLMFSQHLGFDALVGLKRLGRIPQHRVDEDPRPHRFARSVGSAFLGLAALAFLWGANPVGWVLAITVALLALLSLTTRICVGCFLYFQLRMLQHHLSRSRS
ncbi:DUF4395 domain-containing protein [Meiothermus granaticius]|uniref:DUF4395 domain-containing protein n=1 Tax=Meiothermus granaticius NBRC 107808 TaxID=1227551 RepID=A0A399FBG5_9DEIN|nr:DUF4395 domain-containing protein [Meiothermus granaticius]RIH93035.1 hypothetical protein Mgrana_00994 [Meiothermus granaticius NBRC 107808]GEM86690.1 hypothetical protein MGR01S_13150 [Meiothermus granaticius NBRC 107808]